jgi:protein-disulfide isomerase
MFTRPTLTAAATALALVCAPAAMAQDFDFDAMSEAERTAFGAQVRAYLMENPQVIMDAVAVLEQQQQQQQAAADDALVTDNLDRLLEDGFSYVGGNPEGDVTVVEFMDYRCGYCRKAHPEVEELLASDGNIRLIVKEFPILGEASLISSQFAIATQIVAGDEAYKAVHDTLITLDGTPGAPQLQRIAETLGLDYDAIAAEMESDEVARRIAETRQLAVDMQINGTPSFVFGDAMVRGYVPLDAMQQIVAELRAE